jgi:hypothetical protein
VLLDWAPVIQKTVKILSQEDETPQFPGNVNDQVEAVTQ